MPDELARVEVIRVADTARMRPLADIEAEVFAIALARYPERGGRARAMRELGIGRSTLYRWLAKAAGDDHTA